MAKHRVLAAAGLTAAVLALTLGVPQSVQGIAPGATAVHFTAAGDYAMAAPAQAVLAGVKTLAPDLNLALGDMSYAATGQEQAFCDMVTQNVGAGFPFELVSGNHESSGQNGNINDFSACLPNQLPGAVGTYGREYYVDVPQGSPLVRFIMISPGLPYADGTWTYATGTSHYNWTQAAIDGARAAGTPWVVVGMHKPCLTMGKYACEAGPDIMNLLVSKKVDLVLTGHEHLYQRTKQLAIGPNCPSITPGTFTAGCVADSDSTLVKGAGTVFATVGTGGNGNYDIVPDDAEAPYFASAYGNSGAPLYGSLDVTANATQLTASFARAAGATFNDGFVIGPPAAGNQPPNAVFASSCTDLGCSFDGTGSSDPDGTIATFAWDFGDGASGTGGTVTHTYAAAGTYTARLTVTDDAGATSTATRILSVTAPPPPTDTLAADPFERSVTSGWGSAPTGGAWTLAGSSSLYSVSGGAGRIQLPTGSGGTARLAGVSATGIDLRLALGLDKLPSSGNVYVTVQGRRIPTAGAYASKVIISSVGKVTIQIVRVDQNGGNEVVVQASTVVPVTYTAGARLNVRVRTTGTAPTLVETKAWLDGTTEPSAWQRSATDATAALQGPGGLAITGYLSGGVANTPVTMSVDDLTAVKP
ncbi:PKD domain-containing protein [Leifsonia sp. fls2-241-R2A-40a]|uniref:PKD domain-containing protein n=1 Tax=Leifsonia sp. fls2-241-R2A-40a TaxID=3040290 RepID=UPI00254F1205|nr:PKD domain-containing protein [Leifsonia sp. fls2-241-R2A-40a]